MATTRKTKTSADPLLARPDGSRATSAWLTSQRKRAQERLDRWRKHWPQSTFVQHFQPGQPLDQLLATVTQTNETGDLACWVLLMDWHGEAVLHALEDALPQVDAWRLICTWHSDAAQDLLFRHLDQATVRAAVLDRASLWPLDTLRRLLAHNPSRTQPAAALLLKLVHEHPDWLAALQNLLAQAPADDAQASAERKTLERLLTPSTEAVTEAALDELPAILRQPPWLHRTAQSPLPELALLTAPDMPVLHWARWPSPPQQCPVTATVEQDFRQTLHNWGEALLPSALVATWSVPKKALFLLGVPPQRLDAVLAADTLAPGDLQALPSRWCSDRLSYLCVLSDGLALSVLQHWADPATLRLPDDWGYSWNTLSAFIHLAHHFRHLGPTFITLLLRQSQHKLQKGWLPLLGVIESTELAAWLSRVGYPSRQHRAYVQQWLGQYPACAARALIPLALGADPVQCVHARYHLYGLARQGHRAAIDAEAARHGPAAVQGMAQLLAVPLESLLPSKLPTLPKWLALHALPPLRLAASGHAIPQAQIPAVLMCMALCKGGMPYEGLTLVEQAVSPESFSRFALALFQQWLDNDAPGKDRWVFELQGRLGDDATARRLAPCIRQWRANLDRLRAYEGLAMLAQIGSDTALMLLYGYAQQASYTDLVGRATDAIQRVADERGLTLDELADRTVPTLGLDERGGKVLDFGPRQFQIRLTPELAPLLTDGQGALLKTLPKPNRQDDAMLAKEAAAEWKDFKKQLQTVASAQVTRLELAMCQQRRWSVAEFQRFFVQHPLLRGLVQRLVWAVFGADGALHTTLRVAEELECVALDERVLDLHALPEGSRIGLPHPLELPQALRQSWGQLLADYAILQPFEQLARPLYTLSDEELTRADLPRYADRHVGTGSLLGLENRGWKRHAGDGGQIDHFAKPVAPGWVAELWIEGDWFIAGPPPTGESLTLTGLHLTRSAGSTATDAAPRWAELPPIARAEMLRDLEKMVWHTQP